MISEATNKTLSRVTHGHLVISVLRSLGYLRGDVSEDFTDELISAGLLALTKVEKNFNSSKGLRFSTFAFLKIRGAMLDELRKATPLFGRVYIRRIKVLNRVEEILFQKTEKEPTEESIRAVMKLDRRKYDALRAGRTFMYRRGADQKRFTEPDRVFDKRMSVDARFDQDKARLQLDLLMQHLYPQHRKLLELVYIEGYKVSEAAMILGLKPKSASTIRNRALMKLRIIAEKGALV